MGLYARYLLPRLVDLACGSKPVRKQREKVVPLARGRVLEIGFGSGMNLAHYDGERVEGIWALEPSVEMWKRAGNAVATAGIPVEVIEASAEEIPLADGSVDTVLTTFSLCTIPDVEMALREMRRVLKPAGHLIFCEHGVAPDAGVRRWQNWLNPVWSRLAGGCNLNRDIPGLIRRAGFDLGDLSTMYIPGPKFASYNYWGEAVATASEASRPGTETKEAQR